MTGVPAVSPFNPSTTHSQRREQNQEAVATGVGATAGLTTAATKAAGKRGLQSGEKVLTSMLDSAQAAAKTAGQNSKEVTGLWNSFKLNIAKYTKDILTRVEKFKNTKYIGAIVKSPITKGLASFCGGALAFFVLITGVSKAIRTGAIAVDDLKKQYNEMFG